MRTRLVLLLLLVALVITGPVPKAVQTATAAESKGRSSRPKKTPAVDVTQTLNAIVEAQRMLTVDLSQLRDELNDVQDRLGDARDEVRQNRDTLQGALEQIKGMREEVRGLYVESSGLKGDIAQVGKQVDDLGASLGSFRLSAGIVVAVVVVLQVVLMGLMFRGRG